jgi:hypothetical protein
MMAANQLKCFKAIQEAVFSTLYSFQKGLELPTNNWSVEEETALSECGIAGWQTEGPEISQQAGQEAPLLAYR